MTPERVLQHPPLVLDQRQRDRYFADGFLAVPGYVGSAWLDRLRAVVSAKIEESRTLKASDDQFDLAPDHSAEKPNIRRLRKAVDQHPELWAFANDPTVVDLDDDGRWTGAIGPRDVTTLPVHAVTELCGPAGTVVLLHCRVVHGSATNYSSRMRPLLLNVYSSADALPITPAPTPTSKTGMLLRGHEPTHVHMEPYPARLPPRWDQVGYRSVFAAQAASGPAPTSARATTGG